MSELAQLDGNSPPSPTEEVERAVLVEGLLATGRIDEAEAKAFINTGTPITAIKSFAGMARRVGEFIRHHA
jgi:hypothetical protein